MGGGVRKAQSMGYLSHAAGTCGLHVHISRLAFGCTYEQQEGRDCAPTLLRRKILGRAATVQPPHAE